MITVATANVQDLPDLSRKEVRKCGRTLARMAVSVAGLQETAEHQDIQDLRDAMLGYEVIVFPGTALEDSIVYHPDVLHLEWTDAFKAHDGLSGVSPDRWTTKACFTRVRRPRLRPFVLRNRHMVSKSASDPRATHLHDYRIPMWERHWRLDRDDARALHADGLPVFDVGDFNRRHVDKYVSAMRWLVNDGYDKVGFTPVVAPDAPGFEVLEVLNEPDPSDHNARGVRGRLTRDRTLISA